MQRPIKKTQIIIYQLCFEWYVGARWFNRCAATFYRRPVSVLSRLVSPVVTAPNAPHPDVDAIYDAPSLAGISQTDCLCRYKQCIAAVQLYEGMENDS
jgi:hypothetical protein